MGDYASMIDNIDTAIANLVAGAYHQVTIDGRTFNKANLDELRRLRSYYVGLESSSASSSSHAGVKFFTTTQPGTR